MMNLFVLLVLGACIGWVILEFCKPDEWEEME